MEWKNRLTRTPYLVFFVVLLSVGVGTAFALITITLAGNVIITDDLTVDTNTLVVDSVGNKVGIGTVTPSQPLDVKGNTVIDGSLDVSNGPIYSHRNPSTNTANLVIERTGGPTSDNVQFTLSHRATNKDLWIYGFDGTTFKNFVGFDYPNYKINFPINGNALTIDGVNDQVTIEGKDFEMGWNSRVPSNNTLTVVDSSNIGIYGAGSSITIGVDGLPIISYHHDVDGETKVAKCENQLCTSSIINSLDTSGSGQTNTSITIGADGLPVISYFDNSDGDLKVAKCDNQTCSSSTNTTLDSAGVVGAHNSITIGVDGLPIISYQDGSNSDLKVAKCDNQTCSSSTVTTIDSDGYGSGSSITIGVDGLPIISYYGSNNNLKVAKCHNQTCNSSTVTTPNDGETGGINTSITIGVDGLPIISHFDGSNQIFKVTKCGNPFCIPNWIRR